MSYVEMTPDNVEPKVKKAYEELLSRTKLVKKFECAICRELLSADNEKVKMWHLMGHVIDDRVSELWEAGKTLKEIDDLYHIFHSIMPDLPDSYGSFLECHHNINKANCFVISYLQCCDKPAYRISEVDHNGKITVWGIGGWSGGYGCKVDLGDLREPSPPDQLYVDKRGTSR